MSITETPEPLPQFELLPTGFKEPIREVYVRWADEEPRQSLPALACLVAIETIQLCEPRAQGFIEQRDFAQQRADHLAEQLHIAQAEVAQLRERMQMIPTVVVTGVLHALGVNEVTIDFDAMVPPLAEMTQADAEGNRWTYTLPTTEQPK